MTCQWTRSVGGGEQEEGGKGDVGVFPAGTVHWKWCFLRGTNQGWEQEETNVTCFILVILSMKCLRYLGC